MLYDEQKKILRKCFKTLSYQNEILLCQRTVYTNGKENIEK